MDDVSSETPLRPGMLEGLDADACARLRRCGIDNVGELACAGPLDVARATEIALSRVARWQALATRCADGAERLHTLHPSPRFSPTETAFFPSPVGLEREIAELAARDSHAG
jgi:hypothetical protein